MKKLSLLLIFCLLISNCTAVLGVFAADSTEELIGSGECGSEAVWELDSDGVLTVSGKGDMTDYTSYTMTPWYTVCSAIKKVVIDSGITSVGNLAFSNCYELKEVVFADSVTEIGNRAFQGSMLTSATITPYITKIDWDAYSGCSTLASVYITDLAAWCNINFGNFNANPLYHGATLYVNGLALTSLSIPETVTNLKYSSFCGYKKLTSVSIPSQLRVLADSTFYKCENLTNFYASNSEYFTAVDGVLYNKDKTYLYAFPAAKKAKSFVIPDTVKTVGGYAFACSSIEEITLPESIQFIGQYAFTLCGSLNRVNAPSLDTWCDIYFSGTESNPLYYGHDLYIDGNPVTDIVVDKLNFTAFVGCHTLKTVVIEDGITVIEPYSLAECVNLKSVALPKTLKTIESNAFTGSGIEYIVFPDSLTEIGSTAFNGCTRLKNFKLPSGLEKIGYSAFANCDSLTEVTVPDSVTAIESGIFRECDNLVSVTFPKTVTKFANYIFYFCESLTTVNIPENVTKIDDYTFYGCNSLKEIKLPSSLQSIGIDAFGCCEELEEIELPDSVTALGTGVFYGCTGLKTVKIGKGVKALPRTAFSQCYSLESVTLSEGLKSIGVQAFQRCESLVSIVIPDTVTSIETSAFSTCYSLTSVTLGSGVTSIGTNAFLYCYSLYEVCNNSGLAITAGAITYGKIAQYAKNIYSTNSGNSVLYRDGDFVVSCIDGKYGIQKYVGANRTNIILPTTLKYGNTSVSGYKLNAYAFYNVEFSALVIPKGVTLDSLALYMCSEITLYADKGSAAEEFASGSTVIHFADVSEYTFDITISGNTSLSENSGNLFGITAGTDAETVLEQLENGKISLVDVNGNELTASDKVGTGTKAVLKGYNGAELDSLTLVVRYDIDGDGETTATDYGAVKTALKQQTVLSECQRLAADSDENGTVNTTDYLLLKYEVISQ